jgi:hypothetical protein
VGAIASVLQFPKKSAIALAPSHKSGICWGDGRLWAWILKVLVYQWGAIAFQDLDTVIALNLLTQGIAIEVITKATGLTIAQIQQLQDGHRS